MGTTPAVRPATTGDLDGMAEALSLSFRDDPVMQWLFGDQPPRPMRYSRPFFTIEGRRHLQHETVYTADGHPGAPTWRARRRPTSPSTDGTASRWWTR